MPRSGRPGECESTRVPGQYYVLPGQYYVLPGQYYLGSTTWAVLPGQYYLGRPSSK
jgi:hypothetical protein